ncbi:MAG TPA: GNAT family N-acetyltransferase [Actinomycetes bacterium]|nr:GNAT family N-acetyltransferase [Actinomycetes bacterium]
MAPAIIRDFRPSDTADLYDVCLHTGNSGQDATGLFRHGRLLGDVYVGPYLEFAPEFALVADDGRRAAGYALAVLDTEQFERRLQQDWWPKVQAQYAEVVQTPETHILESEMLAVVQQPARANHPQLPEYPSHLHIDLLEGIRGQGIGRQMMDELFARLRSSGSRGVHLDVAVDNVGAQRFYRRLGFTQLIANDDELFMGLSL